MRRHACVWCEGLHTVLLYHAVYVLGELNHGLVFTLCGRQECFSLCS